MQGDAAEEGGVGGAGAFEDRADLVGAVVDARHQGGDEDAGVDPAAAQLGDRVQARGGARRVRLGRPPGVLVEGRDREVDRDPQPPLRHRRVDLDVAHHQRRLGQDRDRGFRRGQRREDLGHHPVAALDPLVGVGVRPQRDHLPLPPRPPQLTPQQLRHVDLDDDLALEVAAGVEVEKGVGATSEAIVADHPVGDEIAGTRGDVEHLHRAAERLDRDDTELRLGLDCDAIDRPFAADGGVDALEQPELLAEPAKQPDVTHPDPVRPLDRRSEAEPPQARHGATDHLCVPVRNPQALAATSLGVEDPSQKPPGPLVVGCVRPADQLSDAVDPVSR